MSQSKQKCIIYKHIYTNISEYICVCKHRHRQRHRQRHRETERRCECDGLLVLVNRREGVQWVFITLFFPLFARSQNKKLDEKKQGADFELVDPSLRPGPVWGAPLKSVGARRGICRGSARAGCAPGLGGAWLRDTEAVSAPGTSANPGQPGPAGTGTPTNAYLCPEGPLVAAFLRPLLTGAGSPLPPLEVDSGRATPSPAPPQGQAPPVSPARSTGPVFPRFSPHDLLWELRSWAGGLTLQVTQVHKQRVTARMSSFLPTRVVTS